MSLYKQRFVYDECVRLMARDRKNPSKDDDNDAHVFSARTRYYTFERYTNIFSSSERARTHTHVFSFLPIYLRFFLALLSPTKLHHMFVTYHRQHILYCTLQLYAFIVDSCEHASSSFDEIVRYADNRSTKPKEINV